MNRRYFLSGLVGSVIFPAIGVHSKKVSAQKTHFREYELNIFSAAGFQYYDGPAIFTRINTGDKLLLSPEPENPYDRFAVEMFWNQHKMGYIPRSDNRHISRLLRQGADLNCRVVRISDHADSHPWNALKARVSLLM